MPLFYFHFHDGRETVPDEFGIEYGTLEQAYLGVCKSIPGIAKDLLIKRQNPLAASYTIADAKGVSLMRVPFTEILNPTEWLPPKARRRPHDGFRSDDTRNRLALASFRQMFGKVDAGCVLMTPEMHIVEMNTFGARHSHVDQEAIRHQPIFDIFSELRGKPKQDFDRFMSLAQAGVVSRVVDLRYLVLDEHGQTMHGFWNARTWPIFDDDQRLLGFAEWAEPHTKPTRGGKTLVEVTYSAMKFGE